MNKNYLLFTLNVYLGLIIAQSPITLGNNNMPGSGDTLRYTNFQITTAGNYAQTDTNFYWDFSQVTSLAEGVRSFKSGLQTPYSILFGLNAYGEKIADTIGAGPLTMTNYYNFYKKQNSPSAFIADGVGLTFSSVPVPSYYSDKDELYNFPMTYPKYDSTTFKFTTTTGGFIPISYSKVGYRVTVVDGWGLITTPYGTEKCLRLITTQYATDSLKNSIVPIPLGFPNYQRSYQWLTLDSKIPYLEITGSLIGTNFTPTQAQYRGYPREQNLVGVVELAEKTKLTIHPNPVKDILYLSGNVAKYESYEIYSLEGKVILSTTANVFENKFFIDISKLNNGIYLLKTNQDGKTECHKFIKE